MAGGVVTVMTTNPTYQPRLEIETDELFGEVIRALKSGTRVGTGTFEWEDEGQVMAIACSHVVGWLYAKTEEDQRP